MTGNAAHLCKKKGTLTNQSAFRKIDRLLGAEDRVFSGFGDLELHNALGRDLDRFAGGGVAADTGGAVLELELAETGQREGILRVFVRQLRELIEILDGLFFRDANFLSERGRDLGL